jgi:hypothetical protein
MFQTGHHPAPINEYHLMSSYWRHQMDYGGEYPAQPFEKIYVASGKYKDETLGSLLRTLHLDELATIGSTPPPAPGKRFHDLQRILVKAGRHNWMGSYDARLDGIRHNSIVYSSLLEFAQALATSQGARLSAIECRYEPVAGRGWASLSLEEEFERILKEKQEEMVKLTRVEQLAKEIAEVEEQLAMKRKMLAK